MAKLKIAGAWSGILEVELETWTVAMLREEVAKRSDCVTGSINLIFSGKLLKDDDESHKLSELGLKNNAKILATRVSSSDQAKEEFIAEEERSIRLSRLKAAAISLSKRHADGSLPVEDFNLELENQSGDKVQLGSETDQRAIMMGLMLHANAKQLIRRHNYKDALEVLAMGEEAFSLCQSKVIEHVDNVSILQIDMVWCYFMLRDITWLSEAGKRLSKAREGILRSHGKESSRVRQLQGGRYPELALHLRLELLEGVAAYHSGQLEKSRRALTSAQAKYMQLQVSDEALSLLMSMGYNERESKRALRMSNQNVESAVDFIVEERAKRQRKVEDDVRRMREIREQKKYGKTPQGKGLDLQRLNELVSIGFEKALAAEALRRNENDTQSALDDLTNPETNSAIQLDIETRKRKRMHQATNAAIEELVSMGFPRALVAAAVRTLGTKEQALAHLLEQQNNSNAAISTQDPNPNSSGVGPVTAPMTDEIPNAEGTSSGSQLSTNEVEVRDIEMEDALTEELQNADPYSDYDIEVVKEIEAVNEYLSLLASAENNAASVPSSK